MPLKRPFNFFNSNSPSSVEAVHPSKFQTRRHSTIKIASICAIVAAITGVLGNLMWNLAVSESHNLPAYNSTVERLTYEYLNHFANSGQTSLDPHDFPEFIATNLENLHNAYSVARDKYNRARNNLTAILREEYVTYSDEELNELSKMGQGDNDNFCRVNVAIRGHGYSMRVDMRELPALFPRYKYGCGPRNALKSYVWTLCN